MFAFFYAVLLTACDQYKSGKSPPQITSQGFIIQDIQKGTVGKFSGLRLRIESPARIKNLIIKERSYEVDLATTPERSHFKLFGLQKKPLFHTDVTLDFQNYINQKLNIEGAYEFSIEVVDKNEQSEKARIDIILEKTPAIFTPVETGSFKLQREGKNELNESENFGVTWKTIDAVKVTIQIEKAAGGASKLVRFSEVDYENMFSKEELEKRIVAANDMAIIVFDTANNAAAYEVVGLANQDEFYLLKINLSDTFLSHVGTTVTLNGEYKF